MDINKVIIIGRLGRDPELRTTASGMAVVSFTVAVNRGTGEDKKVDWIPVTVWDKMATVCDRYLTKGSQVGIAGRLQSRQYQDKQGNNRTALEVVASDIQFLGGKAQTTQDAAQVYNQTTQAAAPAPAQKIDASGATSDWERQAIEDMNNGYINSDDLPF